MATENMLVSANDTNWMQGVILTQSPNKWFSSSSEAIKIPRGCNEEYTTHRQKFVEILWGLKAHRTPYAYWTKLVSCLFPVSTPLEQLPQNQWANISAPGPRKHCFLKLGQWTAKQSSQRAWQFVYIAECSLNPCPCPSYMSQVWPILTIVLPCQTCLKLTRSLNSVNTSFQLVLTQVSAVLFSLTAGSWAELSLFSGGILGVLMESI